jgi:hypothetical protein
MRKHIAVAVVVLLSGAACEDSGKVCNPEVAACGRQNPAEPPGRPGEPTAPKPCNLGSELEKHAGAMAIDCGYVALEADPSAADACVAGAMENGQAFRVRYQRQGIDSPVEFGAASPGGRAVTLFLYDGPLGFQGTESVIYAFSCNGAKARPTPTGYGEWWPAVECASTGVSSELCQSR